MKAANYSLKVNANTTNLLLILYYTVLSPFLMHVLFINSYILILVF
jgi:hypothetical protein